MKVALYVRRSSDSQDESLNTQLELLEAEGKRKGWDIVARYRDTISGTSPARTSAAKTASIAAWLLPNGSPPE